VKSGCITGPEILLLNLAICFPLLETRNCFELGTFRGNGFYNIGKRLILFPKLETASTQKKRGSSGKGFSNAGKPET